MALGKRKLEHQGLWVFSADLPRSARLLRVIVRRDFMSIPAFLVESNSQPFSQFEEVLDLQRDGLGEPGERTGHLRGVVPASLKLAASPSSLEARAERRRSLSWSGRRAATSRMARSSRSRFRTTI